MLTHTATALAALVVLATVPDESSSDDVITTVAELQGELAR